MGINKKNRSKQRKAKVAEKSVAVQDLPKLIKFHPDDDINGLLDFILKGKKIDCIKLAKFLPNAAKDIKEKVLIKEDLLFAIERAHLSKSGVELSEKTMYQIKDSITGFYGPFWSIKNACWQCEEVNAQNLSVCSGCKVANYCSSECQLQAWKDGHKAYCSHVKKKFQCLQESYDIIESTHKNDSLYPGAKFNILSDYSMVSHVHCFPTTDFFDEWDNVDEILEPRSMKFFYQNFARVQQGWYPVTVFADKGTGLHEYSAFSLVAQALSFDLLTYCSIMFKTTDPETVVDFIPLLTGSISISAERFLELYYTGQEIWTMNGNYVWAECNGEKADSEGRWKRTRRLLKRDAIENFRRCHHTGEHSHSGL